MVTYIWRISLCNAAQLIIRDVKWRFWMLCFSNDRSEFLTEHDKLLKIL